MHRYDEYTIAALGAALKLAHLSSYSISRSSSNSVATHKPKHKSRKISFSTQKRRNKNKMARKARKINRKSYE